MRDSRTDTASRRRFIAATATTLSVLAAGCLGGDDETPSNTANTPNETPAPTSTPPPRPAVEVEFNYFEQTHLVDVFHAGGDGITVENTGRLEVRGDVSAEPLLVNEDGEAPFEEGDELFGDITIMSGDTITIHWQSNDGDRTSKLGQFTAP